MTKKPLRVGFDLDGVILYNPTRIVRPILDFTKRIVFKKNPKKVEFYFPKDPLKQKIWIPIWKFFHLSSLFVAPGYQDILTLAKEGKIIPYIVSARYSFLEDDFNKWMNKLDVPAHFHSWHFNMHNEQPHEYKERVLKNLKLDVFVEDNWDIVKHLNEKLHKDHRVFWIYNVLDRGIPYTHKFPSLAKAVDELKKHI